MCTSGNLESSLFVFQKQKHLFSPLRYLVYDLLVWSKMPKAHELTLRDFFFFIAFLGCAVSGSLTFLSGKIILSSFFVCRYGLGAGPDAGRFPLPSSIPRALQHVPEVHASQAHPPRPAALLQGQPSALRVWP